MIPWTHRSVETGSGSRETAQVLPLKLLRTIVGTTSFAGFFELNLRGLVANSRNWSSANSRRTSHPPRELEGDFQPRQVRPPWHGASVAAFAMLECRSCRRVMPGRALHVAGAVCAAPRPRCRFRLPSRRSGWVNFWSCCVLCCCDVERNDDFQVTVAYVRPFASSTAQYYGEQAMPNSKCRTMLFVLSASQSSNDRESSSSLAFNRSCSSFVYYGSGGFDEIFPSTNPPDPS